MYDRQFEKSKAEKINTARVILFRFLNKARDPQQNKHTNETRERIHAGPKRNG